MRRHLSTILGVLAGLAFLLALAGLARRWWLPLCTSSGSVLHSPQNGIRVLCSAQLTSVLFGTRDTVLTRQGLLFALTALLAGGALAMGALLLRSARRGPRPLLFRRSAQGEILQRCSDRGHVEWIPRLGDPPAYLQQHPRVMLIGRSGAGKTREALELVGAASGQLSERMVAPAWGPAFDLATQRDLQRALTALHGLDQAAVLWLDDLHHHLNPQSAERLSELVALLEQRGPLTIVGTMRSVPETPGERRWFRELGISFVALSDMPGETVRRLAERIGEAWEMTLNDTLLRMIVSQADHRPEQVYSVLRCLLERGFTVPTEEQMAEALDLDLRQRWEEDRTALAAAAPAADALLGALETFYAAGQEPEVLLVWRYAAGQVRWRERFGLRRAQRLLRKHPYFRLEGQSYLVNEIALEGKKSQEEALARMSRFFSRLPAAPGDERLREAQKGLALGLGAAYQWAGALDMAAHYYARAAALDPRCAPAYSAWGSVWSARARSLARAGHSAEARTALSEAGTRYARAVALKPELYETHALWGNALDLCAQLAATGGQKEDALADWREADEHYARAIRLKPGSAPMLAARSEILDHQAGYLARNKYRREALAAWRDAAASCAAAMRLQPDYAEALIAWGRTLGHRAELLAQAHGRDEALAALAEADERLAQAATLQTDDPSLQSAAYSARGDILAHRGRLLAERGQDSEALAALDGAAQHYSQAVALQTSVLPQNADTYDGADAAGLHAAWGRALDTRAGILGALGRSDDALEAWTEADRHYAKSIELATGGETAIGARRERGQILTRKARLLTGMGRRREAAGTLAEAEICYTQLAEAQPGRREAALSLASLAHERGRLLAETRRREEAIALLRAADQHYAQAEALRPEGKGEEGGDVTTPSGVTAPPASSPLRHYMSWALALSLRGQLLMQDGREEEALEALSEAAERYAAIAMSTRHDYDCLLSWGNTLDAQAQLLAQAARHREALDAWADADEAYSRAVECVPDSPPMRSAALAAWGQAFYSRAQLMAGRDGNGRGAAVGAWREGDRCYSQAVSLAVHKRELLQQWALKLHQKGLYLAGNGLGEEAAASWQVADRCHAEILALAPDDPLARNAWGNALYERGQCFSEGGQREEALAAWEGAIARYNQAIALREGYLEALYNRTSAEAQCGWTLILRGMVEQGLARLERSNEMRAAFVRARPLDDWDRYRLAFVALARGDELAAEEHLRLAIEGARADVSRRPGDARRNLDLALYLLVTGEADAALAIYRQAPALNPSPGELHQAGDDLLALAALAGRETVQGALEALGLAEARPL